MVKESGQGLNFFTDFFWKRANCYFLKVLFSEYTFLVKIIWVTIENKILSHPSFSTYLKSKLKHYLFKPEKLT